MTKWLASLLHRHKWKVHTEVDVFSTFDRLCIGKRFYLQCTHCGVLKAQHFGMAEKRDLV